MAATTTPADPFEIEIEKVQSAIAEVQESQAPEYIAAPWKRRDLIEQLTERIATLRQVQAEKAQAATQREQRQRLQNAWDKLAPKRQAFAQRWNACREEMRTVLAAAKELDAEHLSKSDRRALSELLSAQSLLSARAEVLDTSSGPSAVLIRPSDL